jgi:hypothetical protein
VVNAVVFPDGGDWGVIVGTQVGSDLANDGGGCLDWAQRHVARCHMGCCVVLLILFLHFEGDVDAVGIFKRGIIVVYEPSFFEESKVLEAKDFGLSFVLLLDFGVLARMYGKEKGKNGELQYNALQHCQFPFFDFGNDGGGDGFLLLFFGVFVFEGSELML